MTDRCLYFGCWNQAGHFLYLPGGRGPWHTPERALCALDRVPVRHIIEPGQRSPFTSEWVHMDGTLAPQRYPRLDSGISCYVAHPDRQHLYGGTELPQGQFLRHVFDYPTLDRWTLISWWDRNQGDGRGACNSTILFEGDHTSEEVLAAGRQHFPHVFENLDRAGIALVEVHIGDR